MKQILKYSYFFAAVSMFFTLGACVKNRNDSATDFTQIKPIVEIRDNISGLGNDAGLAYFAKASLSFIGDPHTQSFYVNMASVYALDKDVTVTLGIDEAALAAYNADPLNPVKYELFPDSLYSFAENQVTIKAGERVALVSLEFFPTNIDGSKNYMLPISITDASGVDISGNFGTIYYHVVGNPFAGTYNWDFTRIPTQDGSGPPDTEYTDVATLTPISPTQFECQSGYYIGPRYEVTFSANNGVYSNFNVEFNADDVAAMAAGGVTVIQNPKLLVADPVNKIFEIQYVAFNGTAYRYVTDKFYK